MSAPRFHCSDAARSRGDDNAATAARIDVWILVEFAGTWGADPIVHAALPAPVVAALKRAGAEIPHSRVVFIRRRVEPQIACRVFVVRSFPEVGIASVDLPSVADVATVPFEVLANNVVAGAPPLVLVCTHGQHDSCCGRRGYPLFDALRQRGELDVWQCSHIGGDRFAANAVVLPWGLYYGPVEPHQANALADSIQREEIFLPSFRGRCSMPRIVQAAETFVRRQTGIVGREALQFVDRQTLDEGKWRIHLRGERVLHEVVVEQYIAAEAAKLTCSASVMNPVPQFRLLSWVQI